MTDLESPSIQARKRLRVDQNCNSVTMSHQNGVSSTKSSINGSDSNSATGSENDEFTDGDFDESDGEVTICTKTDDSKGIPCNEAVNPHMFPGLTNGAVHTRDKSKMNSLAPKLPPGHENNGIFNENNALISNEDLSIIGILGKDHERVCSIPCTYFVTIVLFYCRLKLCPPLLIRWTNIHLSSTWFVDNNTVQGTWSISAYVFAGVNALESLRYVFLLNFSIRMKYYKFLLGACACD